MRLKIQGKEFPDGELIIVADYESSEHVGADGCFQVVDIQIDEQSILQNILIDQGFHYNSKEEVLEDLQFNGDCSLMS